MATKPYRFDRRTVLRLGGARIALAAGVGAGIGILGDRGSRNHRRSDRHRPGLPASRARRDRRGRATGGVDQAIDLLGLPTSAERARLLGAAHLNRAQAHSFENPGCAVNDYEAALKVLEPGSPQAGMAAHGLGAALLEADQRDAAPERIDRAIEAFGRSLAILSARSQPLRHGMARHSIALAYERRDQPGDLARALHDLEAAMTLFDPRLHKQHWERAAAALARVERELDQRDGRLGRMGHHMNLLAVASEQERRTLIRDRLVRVASFAAVQLRAEIDAMTSEMCRLDTSDYRSLSADFLTVLMELPDVVLRSACASLVLAHSRVPDGQERDVLLDESIHTTLFGPQRVKVSDLLRCNGWNRP